METLAMTFVSGFFGFVIGLPVAFCFMSRVRGKLLLTRSCIDRFCNCEHFPFHPVHYLAGMMIPFTRVIVGTSIGLQAAIVR